MIILPTAQNDGAPPLRCVKAPDFYIHLVGISVERRFRAPDARHRRDRRTRKSKIAPANIRASPPRMRQIESDQKFLMMVSRPRFAVPSFAIGTPR